MVQEKVHAFFQPNLKVGDLNDNFHLEKVTRILDTLFLRLE